MKRTPNIKTYQKKERALSAAMFGSAVIAPVTMTYMVQQKFHWAFAALVGFAVLMMSLWILYYKNSLEQKLQAELETLDVGHVLARKSKSSHRFVITNRGYNHYYIKSLDNGEQLLISRRRAIEDFDIAL